MPVGNHYAFLIGTSTGLYGTDSLLGTKTVWTQQGPNDIGNILVSMIDTRPSDGRVAVATYGNGVYTANINFPYQVSGIDENKHISGDLMGMHIYPNPIEPGSMLHLTFENANVSHATDVEILDEQGKTINKIGTLTLKQNMSIALPVLSKGLYYIQLQIGEATVSKVFIVN